MITVLKRHRRKIMSDFNKIYNDAMEIAKKAAKKGEEIGELAALKIKILAKRKNISDEYKFLGAYVYKKLKTDAPEIQEELTEKIGACVNNIDVYLVELARLNAEYKAKTEAKKNPEPEFTITPEEVMEGFHTACEDAAVACEEAEKLAEEAKEMAENVQ